MFDGLKKAQKDWDEKWIAKEKENWKKKLQNMSKEELLNELEKIGDKEYNAEKSFWQGQKKVALSFGMFGQTQLLEDRSKEAKRRAIKELLSEKP